MKKSPHPAPLFPALPGLSGLFGLPAAWRETLSVFLQHAVFLQYTVFLQHTVLWIIPVLLSGCVMTGVPAGDSPLMAAVGKGDLPQVRRLVARGKDPGQASPRGMTALMRAAEAGHLAIVRFLVEKGAALNVVHRSAPGPGGGYGGRTALEKATARKHPAIAVYLMEQGAAITPFALIRMIEAGGDLSASALNRLNDPQTAQGVLTGVLRMGKWNVAERLFKLGADARKRDPSGNTPVHWAAGWGKIAALRFLLRHGADINAANRFGKTPLDNAAGLHRLAIIKFMLAHGADVRGGAPLASALQALAVQNPALRNPPGGARAARALGVVRYLLGRGAEVNRPGPRLALTPLMLAARAGSLELVRLLVGSGADLDRKSRENRTALLISRIYQRPRVEAYLLKQAAKPRRNSTRPRGRIPSF